MSFAWGDWHRAIDWVQGCSSQSKKFTDEEYKVVRDYIYECQNYGFTSLPSEQQWIIPLLLEMAKIYTTESKRTLPLFPEWE